MSPEKDEALCKKYPTLFKDRFEDPSKTCMCWGFSCGDGWYDLIDKLCTKLMKVAPDTVALQVKEKLGTLSFYVSNTNKEGMDAIDEACLESSRTCERCGEPGKVRTAHRFWIKTLCDECEKEDWMQYYQTEGTYKGD